jgi:16S rRNA (adenine1518-N6/adenine1519-N6)-dimethyltransferase
MGNIVAKKHLGQNFLRNHDILKKIVGNDDFSQKNIVEVGPGPGDLTSEILGRHPISLSLIELDHDMIPLILSRFSTANNIDLYWSDVLKVNITQGERGNDS